VTPPTNDKFYLIATPAFAALPGAPTPDVLLPAGVIPFFSASGDSVDFVTYDTCTFASAPTDGFTSRDCLTNTNGSNSPTNYAGATGSVNANPAPVGVPTLAPAMQWLAVGCLLAGATWLFTRRPRAAVR